MTRFNIVDGPSKWDLVLAVFDGGTSRWREFFFSLEDPKSRPGKPLQPMLVSSVINGVEREDGTAENWLFKGYIHGKRANGFFSTKTRKGWVELDQ